ncbi:MAG TPA: anthranilate phosphoribosyltransferase [Alphaproteobacteria bacterium]|nr:anthranilate phosphoribosyltransferase [Alphaproteobacteria bacterium]
MPLSTVLSKIKAQQDLSVDEARGAFDAIFEGKVPDEQLAAFLLGLRDKGETVNEILGAVTSMRGKSVKVTAPPDAIDIVGTGGDAHGTLNVSTAVAFTVAGCGVPVAKHGNRAASSKSGSSDVLSALGINLEPPLEVLERSLAEAKICFLFAPRHHPAMKHVGDVRKKLGVRTIFNLLGPLTNPANAKRYLMGAYDLEWLGPMAEVLKLLGAEAAWVTHGHDGMDEITTTSPTDVVELRRNMIGHFTLEPEQVGLPRAQMADLKGGDATHNAAAIKELFQGKKSAYRDIVLFNAAAALIVAGKTTDLKQGMALAAAAIDNGAARHTLETLIHLTNAKAA